MQPALIVYLDNVCLEIFYFNVVYFGEVHYNRYQDALVKVIFCKA